jgi:hypothetical protein
MAQLWKESIMKAIKVAVVPAAGFLAMVAVFAGVQTGSVA